MVPPNTEHDLGAVNIRFGRRHESMAENSPWFSALGIIVMNPFFVPSHNAMQKSLPSLPFKQPFTSKQTPFNISRLQFVRHPISLLLNHSHGFEAFWNGLLSHSQWSCQLFLILTRVKVMPPILHLRKSSLFYRYAGLRRQNYRSWSVETTHDTFFH